MELAKYIACICEGSAEHAIMDIFEDRYNDFKKSKKKPSDFCKENLKMHEVKSYKFVKAYFSNPAILVGAIKKYHKVAKIKSGEYTLLDLVK